MKETKQFQAESKELLNLVINSIYSNKEIFLRELLSNASDAIDKYRFLALDANNKLNTLEHKIEISIDKENKAITISDNGIGMSKEDIEDNLGTIAKSGSKEFLEKIKESKDNEKLNIIGQFGVGFYSAFMVAKRIDVISKKINETNAYKFSSDGIFEYSIEEINKEENGTTIVLYLKEDEENYAYSNFLEQYEIKRLVKKYSDYIRYPIMMEVLETKNDLDKDGNIIEGKTHEEKEIQTLNSMIPLWKKNKNDVSKEDLNNFYKDKFLDYEDPLTSINIKVDGLISYNALIFIPAHAPYNLYSENYEKGLDLYAKGIFIKDKCKELVPDYLKFVKGLVDSNDFSLNVSREILQSSPLLKRIETNIETKVINKLKEIKKDNYEEYIKFFDSYGDHIKYGMYSNYGSKNELLKDLLIFKSLNSEDKYISFEDYIKEKKEEQKFIYYCAGKNINEIKLMPALEKFKKDGINVLFLTQNIDEFCLMVLKEYNKIEFKSITEFKEEDLTKEDKDKIESLKVENIRIIDNLKEALKGIVDDVTFSLNLTESPVCLSTKDGLSLNMEHVLKEEQKSNEEKEDIKASKVLEINPNHPLFDTIKSYGNDDEKIKRFGKILYNEALLLEGYDIENKQEFVTSLNELLAK